jgi:hypothetical protein
MQSRHEEADHERNAPQRHPDLEHSSGIAGKGLRVLGAHSDKPMALGTTG